MSWNYRIIDHGDHLALHEVHYDEAGAVKAYTADAIEFVADPEEGPADIVGSLERALTNARDLPVLKAEDLPKGADTSVDPKDPFLRHEALDRAGVIAANFERDLLDHPAVQGDPTVKALAETAMDALSALYQAAGQDPA